eukprot:TRINITY_DN71025_c0_g1_i1.p1 TRINITY_DN71025_c0_g1~~TRINITY_DN71025_c0_g1_i1.p1  ORF type:complete len:633 (+),score=59.43 TRINITY_DN71025_c0_g1_i1:4155-6053(+)
MSFEKLTWKSANCVLISCEHNMKSKVLYDSMLRHGLEIRSQLHSMSCTSFLPQTNIGDREKRVNTGKNKKKRIQSLEEVKTLQYMNEHTMFSLIQMLGSPKPETTPFYIMDKIEYVMNLFNSKAVEKGVTLILSAEPCFPKEVNGDRFKFELILATMVEYLLKKTQNGEIKLYARMKYPFEGGFLLGFDFEVIPSKSLSVEDIRNLQALSSSKLEYWKDSAYTINQSLHIIKHLGGELEITDQPVIKITVELPFLGKESSQECVAENKIGVYRVERPGEFTKKWTAVIGPSETTPGTRRRSPGLPRSITQKFGADEMVARDKIKLAVSKLQGKTASVLVPNGETSTSKLNKNTTFSNKEELLAKIKEEEATKAMGEVRSEIREDSKKGEVQSEMRSVVKDDSESRSEMKDTQSVAKLKLADELSRRESQTPHEVDTPQLDPDLPVQEKAEKKRTFSFTENVGDSSAKPKPDIRVNPDRPEEEQFLILTFFRMVESPRAEAKKIPVNRTRQSKLMLDNWHKQTQSQDQRGSCSVIETNALWNCKEKSGEQFISLPTSQQNIKLELVKNVKSGSVLSKFGKIKAVQEKQRFPTQDYQRMILYYLITSLYIKLQATEEKIGVEEGDLSVQRERTS